MLLKLHIRCQKLETPGRPAQRFEIKGIIVDGSVILPNSQAFRGFSLSIDILTISFYLFVIIEIKIDKGFDGIIFLGNYSLHLKINLYLINIISYC